jgi:hypothetical protein
MALRWVAARDRGTHRGHGSWHGLAGGRFVAEVATEQRNGQSVWVGWYWGDVDGGVDRGTSPRARVDGEWPTADAAMRAVEARHAPGRSA